jgi:membrane protein implicated in regulation of membrane protease activity
MNWPVVYLSCFLIGLMLTVVSFIGGSLRIPHLHLHLHFWHGHVAASRAGLRIANGRADMPHVNLATVTAFLTWFGAAGYLLSQFSTLLTAAILLIAIAAGFAGAAIIFWFVVKFLLGHEHELDPLDYDRVGMLARVVSGIRAGGTGEIIFSQARTRHTCGARAESGEALARGTEVVVTRYEHGIAYVRRWEDLAAPR